MGRKGTHALREGAMRSIHYAIDRGDGRLVAPFKACSVVLFRLFISGFEKNISRREKSPHIPQRDRWELRVRFQIP